MTMTDHLPSTLSEALEDTQKRKRASDLANLAHAIISIDEEVLKLTKLRARIVAAADDPSLTLDELRDLYEKATKARR